MTKNLHLFLRVCGLLLIAACSKDIGPGTEIDEGKPDESSEGLELSIVQGQGQTALPGAQLYDSLVVQLLDESDKPVAGKQIGFRSLVPGSTLFLTEAATDAQGIARSHVTIGDLPPGTHQLVSAFLKSDEAINVNFSAQVVAESEVDTWLGIHPRIADAIIWPGTTPLAYKDWTPTQKTALHYFYQQAKAGWQGKVPASAPPANQNPEVSTAVQLLEKDVWAIYLSGIAVSLHLEVENLLGWSLLDYDESELKMLLDGRTFFSLDGGSPRRYRLSTTGTAGRILPASGMFLRSFMKEEECIQNDRLSTITALLEWCHQRLDHFSGSYSFDNIFNHWHYRGAVPVSQMILGTTRRDDKRDGHYTAGCHGTADFLKIALRSVNIPVVSMQSYDRHRQAFFPTEKLYMAHGDDPYNGYTWVTPAVSMREFLIDQATYDEWFKGPVKKSVSQGTARLAVMHLSNILVYARATEPVGTPPEQSSVFEKMKNSFTLEELMEMGLWHRLDSKINALGGRDRIPEVLIGRYR